MHRLALTILCVLIASCKVAPPPSHPGLSSTLEVTPRAYEGYQEYRKQTNGQGGLFAVTVDGLGPFSRFCKSQTECGDSAEFLETCKVEYSKPCRLVATGQGDVIYLLVVRTGNRLNDDSLLLRKALSENDLRQNIVGSTLQGEYLNKLTWSEYFGHDGEIVGRDDMVGRYKARYRIQGNKLCFDYARSTENWCAVLAVLADTVFFVNEDRFIVHTIRNTRILPGKALTLR